jgi:hypothetical protein
MRLLAFAQRLSKRPVEKAVNMMQPAGVPVILTVCLSTLASGCGAEKPATPKDSGIVALKANPWQGIKGDLAADSDNSHVAMMARTTRLPDGAPVAQDVCFSSRWKRPLDANDPQDTFGTAAAFYATRFDWVYSSDPVFIHEVKSRGYKLSLSVAALMADDPNCAMGTAPCTRNIGRQVNFADQPLTAPWQLWGFAWGCANNPDFLPVAIRYLKIAVDNGADSIHWDDPKMNGAAVGWGGVKGEPETNGCFCPHCLKGFRDYLAVNCSTSQLQDLGITNVASFDYKQYLQQGRRNRNLRKLFVDFQMRADVDFLKRAINWVRSYAGRYVPFSCNNGSSWSAPYDVFDFGIGELSTAAALTPAALRTTLLAARKLGKDQVFTVHVTNTDENRRLIAYCYALGSHLIAPWDVWITGDTRYFGNPSDFNDLYGLVHFHPELLAGYEDAAVYGPTLADSRYPPHDQPVWIENSSSQIYVLTRAIPQDRDAPVIIHLVDWSNVPASFDLKLRNTRFFTGRILKVTKYAPSAQPSAGTLMATSVSHGITTIPMPAAQPWLVVKVERQ